MATPSNPRLQRTRAALPLQTVGGESSSLSGVRRAPLSRKPLGAMKRYASVIVSVILAFGCAHSSDPYDVSTSSLPTLGSQFHPPGTAVATVSRGGTMQTFGVSVAGIRYSVMVDRADSQVVGISTVDPKLSTPEGARVGDTISRVLKLQGRWLEPQRRFLLESGWTALFDSADLVVQFDKDIPNGA